MPCQWKGYREWREHKTQCRLSQAECLSDNLYERIRAHVVRVVREYEGDIVAAARKLGCSEATVRRYMKLAPFEHLMRNPALEDCFDWRSMTPGKWRRLLSKHPGMISHLPKQNPLYCRDVCDILRKQPQLASYFDLQQWNRLELGGCWAELLEKRPEFAPACDFSVITGLAAKYLLSVQPQFFDRIALETLLPYHWEFILRKQPQLLNKLEKRSRQEWPFNFKVFYLRIHPEFEYEFQEWEKIDWMDLADIQRDQPELYARHYDKQSKGKHNED